MSTLTVSEISHQLSLDNAILLGVRSELATSDVNTPTVSQIARCNAVSNRWSVLQPYNQAPPTQSTAELTGWITTFLNNIANNTVMSSIINNLTTILGTGDMENPNPTLKSTGLAVPPALVWAQSSAFPLGASAKALSTGVDAFSDDMPLAFLQGSSSESDGAINASGYEAAIGDKADEAFMGMFKNRGLASKVVSTVRRPRTAYLASTQSAAYHGQSKDVVVNLNAAGLANRDISLETADDSASIQKFRNGKSSFLSVLTQKDGTGTPLAQPVPGTNDIFNIVAGDCLVILEVEIRDQANATPITATGSATLTKTPAIPDAGVTPEMHVSGPLAYSQYVETLRLIKRDSDVSWYTCVIALGDVGEYAFCVTNLSLTQDDAAFADNTTLVYKTKVVEIMHNGRYTGGVVSVGGDAPTGTIQNSAGAAIFESFSVLQTTKAGEDACYSMGPAAAWSVLNGYKGLGRAMVQSYYTMKSTSDTYTPTPSGIEFLYEGWLLAPHNGLTQSTAAALLCELSKLRRDMLAAQSVNDAYTTKAGSC
jgi:hypothetical protein